MAQLQTTFSFWRTTPNLFYIMSSLYILCIWGWRNISKDKNLPIATVYERIGMISSRQFWAHVTRYRKKLSSCHLSLWEEPGENPRLSAETFDFRKAKNTRLAARVFLRFSQVLQHPKCLDQSIQTRKTIRYFFNITLKCVKLIFLYDLLY